MLMGAAFPQIEWYHANSWYDVHALVARQPLDLALLDLNMPGQAPWSDEIQQLTHCFPALPLCILSANSHPDTIRLAFQLGIKGYIPKLAEAGQLQQALVMIMQGNSYIPSQLWERSHNETVYAQSTLTRQQQRIMQYMAQGDSNKQIGSKLKVTESTVKRHIHNIFQTLNVKNRVDAINTARQHGLLH